MIDKSNLDLSGFYGTEQYYQSWDVPGIVYTDGVQYLAEHAKCQWLLQEIAVQVAIYPAEEFLVFVLTVNGQTADLVTTDSNDNILCTEHFHFKDFPLDTIMLWYERKVLMLPTER